MTTEPVADPAARERAALYAASFRRQYHSDALIQAALDLANATDACEAATRALRRAERRAPRMLRLPPAAPAPRATRRGLLQMAITVLIVGAAALATLAFIWPR